MKLNLLSFGTNPKTLKSDNSEQGYLTAILYLSPSNLSGKDLCPFATEDCRKACLNTAGRGKFSNIQNARLKRTKLFLENRKEFMQKLHEDIESFLKYCEKKGVKACIRLNGTSDILWERLKYFHNGKLASIIDHFPQIQFYDYTKFPFGIRKTPKNYSLTYSRANNQQKPNLLQALHSKENVAVVFQGKLPDYYWGYEVINGDLTDLRFLDPKGVIVGLKAKGVAIKQISEFVVAVA